MLKQSNGHPTCINTMVYPMGSSPLGENGPSNGFKPIGEIEENQ
jgi:hypothetical protein